MEYDYKLLLLKYIVNVIEVEGTDFLNDLPPKFINGFEWHELNRLSKEANTKYWNSQDGDYDFSSYKGE